MSSARVTACEIETSAISRSVLSVFGEKMKPGELVEKAEGRERGEILRSKECSVKGLPSVFSSDLASLAKKGVG